MRGKRRPPEERVSNVAGPLPPCRVCGEPAAGFHYGVNTCEACKGFFRRSLLRNGQYDCIGQGNCEITTNRRKACPKCRYQRCLDVGMSKEAIKTGRYTYMKRTQDTLEIRMLKEGKSLYPDGTDTKPKTEILSEDSNSQPSLGMSNPSSPSWQSVPSAKPVDSSQSSSAKALSSETSLLGNKQESENEPQDLSMHIASSGKDSEVSQSSATSSSPPTPTPSSHCINNYTGGQNVLSPKERLRAKLDAALRSEGNSQSAKITSDYANLMSPISVREHNMLSPQQNSDHLISPPLSYHSEASPASPMCLASPQSLSSNMTCSPISGPPSVKYIDADEKELETLINILVTGHKQVVEDCNSLSDEFFDKAFKEAFERCKLQLEVFGDLGSIQREEALEVFQSTGIDVDGRMEDLDYCAATMDKDIRQMITFLKLIPGFKNLCLHDQTALTKACIYEMFILSYFRGYKSDLLVAVEPERSYCWHQMIRLYDEHFLNRCFQITHRVQQLNLTFDLVVVLKALCVFFPDRVELTQYSEVESIHHKLMQCLLLLLRRTFPDRHGLVLAAIMSFFTDMRTFSLECFDTWKKMGMEDYHAVQQRPILIEIMSGSIR